MNNSQEKREFVAKQIELESKKTGHLRVAYRWERQARRDGEGSKAHALYKHHLVRYCAISDELDALKA